MGSDSRTALRNPGLKNGARRWGFYEDRSARISILAGGGSLRPDALKQTDHSAISAKPLADGAGHSFLNVAPILREKRLIIEVSALTPAQPKDDRREPEA
jgi:hypothetical protein